MKLIFATLLIAAATAQFRLLEDSTVVINPYEGLDVITLPDGTQQVLAKVGDTVVLEMEEPASVGHKTWEVLEMHLGFNSIWNLAQDNFHINDDGKTGLRTFKLNIVEEGLETLTFVRGDMTKFDDASDDYLDSDEDLFDLDLFEADEYTQVQIKAEAAAEEKPARRF